MDDFIYWGASKCEEEKQTDVNVSKVNRFAGALNHLLRVKQLFRRKQFRIYKNT